jgi:hypothetical protein
MSRTFKDRDSRTMEKDKPKRPYVRKSEIRNRLKESVKIWRIS